MKNLNVSFDNNEFLKLEEQKGSRSWRKYILQLAEDNKIIEKLQRANEFLQKKLIEETEKNSLSGEKKVLEITSVASDSESKKDNS